MCPLSSANWNNGTNAGVWALNLNNARNNANNNVGFRADSISPHGPHLGRSGVKGDAFRRAGQPAAKSAGFRLSGRARSFVAMRLEGQAT